MESLSPTPSDAGRGSEHRALNPNFLFLEIFLASCWLFTQHVGLNSVMSLLGISKALSLTLLGFYTPSPALRAPLGAVAEPPRCSPPSAGFWGPLLPQAQAECCKCLPAPGPGWREQGMEFQESCCGMGMGMEKGRSWGAAGKMRCARVEGLGLHLVLPPVCPMAQRWS